MSKMRNSLFLVSMLVLCVVPIFSACSNDDSPLINIDNRIYVSSVVLDNESKEIPLKKDSTYKLKYSFEPLEAQNKTVTFSSSNSDVATVDKEGNVTAIGTGSCYITVKSLDNKNAVSDIAVVNVVNEIETLASPTNIIYNGTQLTWSKVSAKTSKNFVPRYEISVSCDGGEIKKEITSANYYTDLPFGKYEVTLRTLGDDGNKLYKDSSETEKYSFTKLGMATELNITASKEINESTQADADPNRTYTLSFALAKNSQLSDYDYKITPVYGSTKLSSTQQAIWDNAISKGDVKEVDGKSIAYITIPKDKLDFAPVTISFGTKTDEKQNIFGSGFDNVPSITVGRLNAPSNLYVASKTTGGKTVSTLTWSNVTNATNYMLKVVYKNSAGEDLKTVYKVFSAWGTNSFDLTSLDKPTGYNSYEVYLYALGIDNTSESASIYIDSEVSQCAKQQLSSVQNGISISAGIDEYTISWEPVLNASSYKVYISDNNLSYATDEDKKKSYNTSNNEIKFQFEQTDSNGNSVWNIGNNYIKVVAVADSDSTYENSDVTVSSVSLIKLATPELKVSKGVLTWDAVSNAEKYVIDFGNNVTYEQDQESGDTAFSYEPTLSQLGSGGDCNVQISAENSGQYIIKSQASQKLKIMRFNKIKQENIKIADGNLCWWGDNAIVDEDGKVIQTSFVEIEISNAEGYVLSTQTTSQKSLSLSDALQGLKGNDFNFRVRAINTESSGTTYINGDWSDSIKTYQMEAPTNLRVENGVLTWDKMYDTNVGTSNPGVRYVIKIDNSVLDTNAVSLGIDNTSVVLENIDSSQAHSISIQSIILSSGGYITKDGTTDTYLINSSFSNPINVNLIPTPTNLRVDGYTLYWGRSSGNVTTYRIYLYKAGGSEPLGYEEVTLTPENLNKPSFVFSTNNFANMPITAGNYEFVVQAIGDNEKYITSYRSKSLSICKLATPQITINDGKISWGSSVSTLDSVQEMINKFHLVVKNKDGKVLGEQKLTTTSTDLSFLDEEYCGKNSPLTLSIQALSDDKNRVYNSDISVYNLNLNDEKDSLVTVYKLPKISVENISINEKSQVIEWTAGDYKNAQGKFTVYVYQISNGKTSVVLNGQTITADNNGKASCNISPNWSGTNYDIVIRQEGYEIKTTNSETSIQNITRYITSELSDAKYFTRFNVPTAIYMTSDNGVPVLQWTALNESPYQRYRITLQKLDKDNNVSQATQLIYYVDYNAENNGAYELNLYTAQGTNSTKDEPVMLKELISEYYGEYQIYITSVPKEGVSSAEIDGKQYLLLYSQASEKCTMRIYSAPTIEVSGINIKIAHSNYASRGVILKFQEVALTDGKYLPTDESILTVNLNSSTSSYEVTDSKLKLMPGSIYQVTTQAVGNNAWLVSSPEVVSDLLVTKLASLSPNRVTATLENGVATNTEAFDGWYVNSGLVSWNEVAGASAYKIYMSTENSNSSKLVLTEPAYSKTHSVALSNMGLTSNYGVFKMQFQVVGSNETEENATFNGKPAKIGYISSDLSSSTSVNKLYAPNKSSKLTWHVIQPNGNYQAAQSQTIDRSGAYARIDEDGEFDFGLRAGDNWLEQSGATAYKLSITKDKNTFGDIIYDLATQKSAKFTASEIFEGFDMKTAGRYLIDMYSIGNNWYGDANTPIYLNSDAENSFTLIYSGVISDLGVTDGQITWLTKDKSDYSYFDLKYTVEGSTDYNQVEELYDNVFDFEGETYQGLKGSVINNLYVRFKGKPTTSTAIEGYVNTGWNKTPLNNIIKLPDIEKTRVGEKDVDLYINNKNGRLSWTMGDNLKGLQTENDKFKFNIDVEVGGSHTNEKINLENQAYTVTASGGAGTSSDGISNTYKITAYVVGTTGEYYATAQDGSTLYLNSSEYYFEAGKLNTPKADSFKLDTNNGSVRVSWDLEGCDVTISSDGDNILSEADIVLLKYYLNGDTNNPKEIQLSAKECNFNNYDKNNQKTYEGGTAFWELGTFSNMTLTVLNSTGSAFCSESIALDYTEVTFDCFESGNGTKDSPFIITNSTQLSNMYWLPEKYFRLNNDIKLEALSDLQKLDGYENARTNILYPKEFYDASSTVSAKYKARNLTGGFDGDGHTISNYQAIKSTSLGIWNRLVCEDDADDFAKYDNSVFRNMSGIITNLKIEVNTIDVSQLLTSYNGVIVSTNAGLIYNCHVLGDNNKLIDNVRASVVEGTFKQISSLVSKYYIGGIAGYVTDNKNVVKVLNPSAENQVILYEQAYIGRIENCSNMLDLEIYNADGNYEVAVGGIAGYVGNGIILNCTNGLSNADTSMNCGKIAGYYAGGIVGYALGDEYSKPDNSDVGYGTERCYARICGCVNYANVNTRVIIPTGEEASSASFAGGIAGDIGYTYITYSINYGAISTDGGAAYIGGISGSASVGAYMSNVLNMGTINYSQNYSYLDSNGEEVSGATQLDKIKTGAFCGYVADTLNLFNSATNTDCIIYTYYMTTEDGQVEAQTKTTAYYNNNAEAQLGESDNLGSYENIKKQSVSTVNSSLEINATQIKVGDEWHDTIVANVNGAYPYFADDWTIAWKSNQLESE